VSNARFATGIAAPLPSVKPEAHLDVDLNCDGVSILGCRLEFPLPNGLNSFFVEAHA